MISCATTHTSPEANHPLDALGVGNRVRFSQILGVPDVPQPGAMGRFCLSLS